MYDLTIHIIVNVNISNQQLQILMDLDLVEVRNKHCLAKES